ncbi:MAG TPA: hypothetical protein ENK07_08520, partial [Bacteroidetes bacterium]|nr:hypothetical protein [Bacteroidota bacterium]
MTSHILTTAASGVDPFALRPFAAAKVSEISEATALSRVPPQERVNFHIGNPVQDSRLVQAYKRLLLGKEPGEPVNVQQIDRVAEELGLDPELQPLLELMFRSVDRSVTYLPRGGFSRNDPGPLAPLVREWLLERQEEPLEYDLGAESGKRELSLASGGRWEALRVLFSTLNEHLVSLPAAVLVWGIELPGHLLSFENLRVEQLAKSVSVAEAVTEHLRVAPDLPHFVLLGAVPSERDRRRLRFLALEEPLRIVEVSNAPNHLSLAREAGLAEIVLRILTPDFFFPELRTLSLTIILGNSELLAAFEKMHFQLKGTPSGPEIELLAFALQHPGFFAGPGKSRTAVGALELPAKTEQSGAPGAAAGLASLSRSIGNYLSRVEGLVGRTAAALEALSERVETRASGATSGAAQLLKRGAGRFSALRTSLDPLGHVALPELLELFARNLADPGWENELEAAFLSAFASQHPEYEPEACLALSGSARTALSLLGFHAGIREVVVPDLS